MSIIRKQFRYCHFNAVYWLIGINIIIFAIYFFLRRLSPNMYSYMTAILCMIPGLVKHGWIWTFITYMFMHASISHLLFNMLGLFIFGTQVERQTGSLEFLLYYLVTGMLAGVLSFFIYALTGTSAVLLGASGAIFAVQLAYAVIFPDSILYLWGILPLRAPVMVLGFTALELIFSITGTNTGVAHLTHLAGFGFGWLYFLARFGVNPWRRLITRR